MLELFDAARFDASLAATKQPIRLFRDALAHAKAVLAEHYYRDTPVTQLVTHHALFIDQLLKRVWQHSGLSNEAALTLVAVGGYGRGELHPYSDIDLMILGESPQAIASQQEAIERFLLLLWDIKLEVGHSVRTIEDCIEQSEADITVATNLMESRRLCGAPPLYHRMREQTDRHHLWPGRDFFEAKWQEQIARHHKFNDTAYNLEPNIKEGPGGLRDIQMIGWVAKRHFGANRLSHLVEHHFLTEDEYTTLKEGQAFLWKIRYGLHLASHRREDRLLFDQQRTLAKQFGYKDENGKLAVEQFMHRYYRTVMELERLNEMLLQLFQEEILYSDDPGIPWPINKRFQSRKGFLEVTRANVFQRYPFALLELFLLLAQNPKLKGVRAETIRQIRNNRHRIDEEFRNDLRNRSLFMELLRQPHGISHELRRMSRYGILAAYLPDFDRVAGQMQHDLFHVYTVDEHTLRVVRNLRRLTVPEYSYEYPLCSQIIATLPKPELIYIAGLYHDIAKGRGGDHSELGAEQVAAFCQKHLLSDYDTRLVVWLVRSHLQMSVTAQRKDISDPEVINDFATKVGDRIHLDYLYLLTVADIRATSPSVWNSWKDALLAELYHATRHALRRGVTNPIQQNEIIAHKKNEALQRLKAKGIDVVALQRFWGYLGDDYFLRYTPEEITWHTEAILQHRDPQQPLLLIKQRSDRGATEIFVYTAIKAYQFSTTTHALDQLGLNIVDALIIPSHHGYTLDTYRVLEQDGEAIEDPFRIEEIRVTLSQRLTAPARPPTAIKRLVARQLKHFPIATQVSFEQDPRRQQTYMEVVTNDRPGILSAIANVLAQFEIQLKNAKIGTFGERVEDVFVIADRCDHALTDEDEQAMLRQALITELAAGEGEAFL